MIKEKYVGVSTKIPINGYLSLIKGEEAKLNVYYQYLSLKDQILYLKNINNV